MAKILLRPLAKTDIKKIWHYTFDKWGLKQADIYTNELGKSIDSLMKNPEIGRPIDLICSDYRLYHFKHHLIIYRRVLPIIEVVRVLGENMDIKTHL